MGQMIWCRGYEDNLIGSKYDIFTNALTLFSSPKFEYLTKKLGWSPEEKVTQAWTKWLKETCDKLITFVEE